MNEKEKRIRISIKMPSAGLKKFIEKALIDDEFFEGAIDNPLQVLKENGVRLNVKSLKPKDLGTFFGALAGAKEMIKKKQLKDISFESVFGNPAVVRGATLLAETERGIWTQFSHDALTNKEMYSSIKVNFNSSQKVLQDVLVNSLRDSQLEIKTAGPLDAEISHLAKIDAYNMIDFAGETVQSRSTDRGVTFHFDSNKGIGSQKSSSIDTYTTKNFANLDILNERSLIESLLNGPLINPIDLVEIASQINTFVNISNQL